MRTEDVNSETVDLDKMSAWEIVAALNREDATVAASVEKVLPDIARGAEMIARSFALGGRLIYVGAGTSGRLGVLDAAECPPTFGSPPDQVIGVIAGGRDALVGPMEGAEDDKAAALLEIDKLAVSEADTVCGISASRRTPYVKTAIARAREYSAATIFICCNPAPSDVKADVLINPMTGAEALTGSTRLKAATATKMILNMLTTASMVLSGKVYKNFMVDLKPLSEKLEARSRRILALALGIEYDEADRALKETDGDLKTALMMKIHQVSYRDALEMLAQNHGRIRI